MSKNYTFTLSEDQARVVAQACEFYARIGYGQYQEILFHFLDWSAEDACERRDEAEEALMRARGIIYPDLGTSRGTSYGIGRNEKWDRAFDVYQVLRQAFGHEWAPFTLLHEPLAKCTVTEGRDTKRHENDG